MERKEKVGGKACVHPSIHLWNYTYIENTYINTLYTFEQTYTQAHRQTYRQTGRHIFLPYFDAKSKLSLQQKAVTVVSSATLSNRSVLSPDGELLSWRHLVAAVRCAAVSFLVIGLASQWQELNAVDNSVRGTAVWGMCSCHSSCHSCFFLTA